MKKELIDYKVKVYLPVTEDINKVKDSVGYVFILPCGNKKYSSLRIEQKLKYCFGRLYDDDIKWETKEINNSNFTIELINEKDLNLSSGLTFYDRYCQTLIKISHPELDSYSIPFLTSISNKRLIQLINKAEYVSENKIHGTFCCTTDSAWSNFEIENPEDKKQSSSKDLGKRWSIERKTTKWIPGYEYYLENGNTVLYLGELKDLPGFFSTSRYSRYYEPGLGFSINTNIIQSYEFKSLCRKCTGHLFIKTTEDNNGIVNFLKNISSDGMVSYVLSSLLTFIFEAKDQSLLEDNLRIYFDKPKTGLVIKKRFVNDTDVVDLKKIIHGFSSDIYEISKCSYPKYIFPLCIDYYSLSSEQRSATNKGIYSVFKEGIKRRGFKDFDSFYNYYTSLKPENISYYDTYDSSIVSVINMLDNRERVKSIFDNKFV